MEYITKVVEYGSEPARFAFKDAVVIYSKIEGLEQLIQESSRYPVKMKHENIHKFYAQFETSDWISRMEYIG